MIDFEQMRIDRKRARREDCIHGVIDVTNAPFGEHTYRCQNEYSKYYNKHCKGCMYYSKKNN